MGTFAEHGDILDEPPLLLLQLLLCNSKKGSNNHAHILQSCQSRDKTALKAAQSRFEGSTRQQ